MLDTAVTRYIIVGRNTEFCRAGSKIYSLVKQCCVYDAQAAASLSSGGRTDCRLKWALLKGLARNRKIF